MKIGVSRCVTAAALVLVVTSGSRTAPILPNDRLPPGDVLSLGRIVKLNLDIRPVPERLFKEGIRTATVRRDWSRMLESVGMAVVPEEEINQLPTLTLRILTGTDEDVGDAILCYIDLRLEQSARFDRIGRELVVPTYVKANVTMEAPEQLGTAVKSSLDLMVATFARDVGTADLAHMETDPNPDHGRGP